jgi:hypothetical protein
MKKIQILVCLLLMASVSFGQIKISALPPATGNISGSVVSGVQAGVTKKFVVDSIAALSNLKIALKLNINDTANMLSWYVKKTKGVQVWIHTGQSNGLGTSDYLLDSTSSAKVLVWDRNINNFKVMRAGQFPMRLATTNGGIASTNAIFYAAREESNRTGDTIKIFEHSIPSLYIKSWCNNGIVDSMLLEINAQVIASGITHIDMVVWHQGEAINTTAQEYINDFRCVDDYFRHAIWGRLDLPVLVTGMPRNYFATAAVVDLADPILQNLQNTSPYITYITTDSVETNRTRGDNFHINEKGFILLAKYILAAKYATPHYTIYQTNFNIRGNDSLTVFDYLGTKNNSPLRFGIHSTFSGILDKLNTGFGYSGSVSSTGGAFYGSYAGVDIDGTAIGYNANAKFPYAAAVGNGSLARNKGAAFGTYCNVDIDGTGGGYSTEVGPGSTGFGHYVKVLGTNSVGIGKYANPIGNNVITFPVAGKNFATVTPNFGLGTDQPTATMHVVGSVKLPSLALSTDVTDSVVVKNSAGTLGIRAIAAYTSCVMKMSQFSTSDPSFLILSNSTGLTFTATRTGVGLYSIAASANVNYDKLSVFLNTKGAAVYQGTLSGAPSTTVMNLYSFTNYTFSTAADTKMSDVDIEIRIYP